ncbi:hypothetical protein [Micavibrio aeruginosavorus]|uniref:Uncharacterized protein n=1 Tax=Micavibrio aeruginosavorus (strain ARL-13) TaxID=856793 RepID=G2KSA2_MICAA|nr:hypothetical protein [Micavibrio aeruginosavorus]AEP08785.1 hypothetical protein MICA_442 [Micavibrio aeruginosavorus ARL-13]
MGRQHFSGAAAGQIAERGDASATVVGKPTEQIDVLANRIGHGLQHGHVDLITAAIETRAAGAVIRATPGGGLAPKGDETVPYKYKADNEQMFGATAPTPPTPGGP